MAGSYAGSAWPRSGLVSIGPLVCGESRDRLGRGGLMDLQKRLDGLNNGEWVTLPAMPGL